MARRRRRGGSTPATPQAAARPQPTSRRRSTPARPTAQPRPARPGRRRHQQNRTPWVLAGLAAFVVVAGLSFLAFQQATRSLPGVGVTDLGNQHLGGPDEAHAPYNTSPPTSGPHLGIIEGRRILTEQIPDELQIHNLEDGHVLVQYDCPDGCPELVRQLEEVVREAIADNRDVLLAPYAGIHSPSGIPARIALTAWARIDTFDEFDRDRIVLFIETFEGIDHHV